jgi:hypothetical protein
MARVVSRKWSRKPGPDCGGRLTPLNHRGSTVTASRCCPGSSRTAAAASQAGPDDLAAELNPHESESQLTYMINIALAKEFALEAGGVR